MSNLRINILHHDDAIAIRRIPFDPTAEMEQQASIDLTKQIDWLIDRAIEEYARQHHH